MTFADFQRKTNPLPGRVKTTQVRPFDITKDLKPGMIVGYKWFPYGREETVRGVFVSYSDPRSRFTVPLDGVCWARWRGTKLNWMPLKDVFVVQ